MTIARAAQRIEPHVTPSPWRDHEYVRGYGVFSLPTTSGDVLVLRVLPQNPFASYRTVWHRNPAGAWSIFVDAATPDIACPRYFGPAAREILPAAIEICWPEPATLDVRVVPAPRPGVAGGEAPQAAARPHLRWTMTISEPVPLRVLNLVAAPLPRWTWKPNSLVWMRELLARHVLKMGPMSLRVTTPSGHLATMCPQRICHVKTSTALLDGRDLGKPVQLAANPAIGSVRLPRRPTFAIGEGYFRPPLNA